MALSACSRWGGGSRVANPRQHVISTPSGPVAVTVAGDGPPVLLLHGFPEHRGIWHPLMAELAGGFRLVAPDLPGFGDSPAPHRETAMRGDRIGAALAAMMRALGHRRFAVVCHDIGAVAGWAMAAAWPGTIAGLALVAAVPPAAYLAAVPDLDARGARRHVARLLSGDADFVTADHLSAWLAEPVARATLAMAIGRSSPTAMRALYRENLVPAAADFWLGLAAPRSPILQVLGDQDPFLPLSLFPEMPSHRHVLHGADHFLPTSAPKALAAVLRPWLAAVATTPSF